MKTVIERHDEELARTAVAATSPRGFVTVRRNERGEVTVRLRPDAFQRLTEADLAGEIEAGMQAAMSAWMEASNNILTRLTGVDHGHGPIDTTLGDSRYE